MPYNETVIENIPLPWIEWHTGYGFPNHSEFKPTYPKWWEGMKARCRDDKCDHRYFLQDVDVDDPFIDVNKFGRHLEYYVRHNCPECGLYNFTRELLSEILKDQIFDHIEKHCGHRPTLWRNQPTNQ